jgi:hypothetical protein
VCNYRTEIIINSDRYVCLQLPDSVPVGEATVTIECHGRHPELPADHDPDPDLDHEDIEWWDEFDDESPKSNSL